MDADEKQFREMNKIPDWEAYDKMMQYDHDSKRYLFTDFQFNQQRTMRNFMKLVIEKLDYLAIPDRPKPAERKK